jgi:hypothetical protein
MTDERFVDPLFRFFLIIIVFVFCLAGLGIILPAGWLEFMMALFCGHDKIKDFFSIPFGMYVLRSFCFLSFWAGIYFYMIARNPHNRRDMLNTGIILLAVLGAVVIITGIISGMNKFIYLGDGVPSTLGALILYRLRPKAH